MRIVFLLLSGAFFGSAQAAGPSGIIYTCDPSINAVPGLCNTLNTTIAGLQPGLAQLPPTIAEARQAMATLNQAMTKMNEGNGTLGRLMSDPALFEETQRAIVTLRRLLADIQQNPAKYIGQLQVF